MSVFEFVIIVAFVAFTCGVVGYTIWLEWWRSEPNGTEWFWYSRQRGIHDDIAHTGWCLSTEDCTRIELPVDRAGRIMPAQPDG